MIITDSNIYAFIIQVFAESQNDYEYRLKFEQTFNQNSLNAAVTLMTTSVCAFV